MQSAAKKSQPRLTYGMLEFMIFGVYFLCLAITVVAMMGCAGAPPIVPYVVDTQLEEVREYRFTSNYGLSSQPTAIHDGLRKANGMICFDMGQAKTFRAWAQRQAARCQKEKAGESPALLNELFNQP